MGDEQPIFHILDSGCDTVEVKQECLDSEELLIDKEELDEDKSEADKVYPAMNGQVEYGDKDAPAIDQGIKRKAADWDEREYKNKKMNHEIEELHAVKEELDEDKSGPDKLYPVTNGQAQYWDKDAPAIDQDEEKSGQDEFYPAMNVQVEYGEEDSPTINPDKDGQGGIKYRYPCGECEYDAITPADLKTHMETIHAGPARVESDPAVDGSGDVKLECVVKEEPGFDLEPLMSNQVPSMFNGVPSMFNQGTSVFNPQSFMFNLGQNWLGGMKQRHACDQCEYDAATPSYLKRHMETVHAGIRYPCDQCPYAATQLGNLKLHKQNIHEGKTYPCDQCEYRATHPRNLKTHKENIHEGLKYPCDQCSHVATEAGNLRRHKRTKHEMVRYPCDQCEYTAPQPGDLKIHKGEKHEGLRYPCDQCDYNATRPTYLRKHKKRKHNPVVVEVKPDITNFNF